MDKKISELDQALQINNDAVFPMSQNNSGTDTTYKASITQIGAEIAEDQTYSNLLTTDKRLVGAINEVVQGGGGGGSSTLAGLSDVDIDDQTLSDGQVLKYDSVEEKWVNDDVGAGGHTIVADDGTDLAQRANLQFIGAYSEDNSVDDTTEINVVRNMTRAQFNQLSADEKTGLINITDESLSAAELPIQSGSATNTKDYIDSSINAPIKSSEVVSISDGDLAVGSNWSEGCFYVKRNGLIILHLALQGLTPNDRNIVYTLPTGCRPSAQIVGAGMGGLSYTAFAQATITTGGVVQVGSVDTYARIHLMYYVNE